MQINGQDQSIVWRREQGRSLVSLEPVSPKVGQQSFLMTIFGFETTECPTPRLPDLEDLSAISRHQDRVQRGLESERQTAWNLETEHRHEIERKRHPTGYSISPLDRPTGLAEGFKKVCERWSLDAHSMARLMHLEEEIGLCELILSGQVPPLTGDLKDRMALVIGISIGLGELFDDDKDAELDWLRSARSQLGGLSPLEHMLKGDLLNLREVVDLLDRARGLR